MTRTTPNGNPRVAHMIECATQRREVPLRKIRESLICGFVVLGLAISTLAVDTRDYSTYIKLKANTTLEYEVSGWPGASAWNPEGEMTDSGYYLIPSGKTLTTKTDNNNSHPAGGTWPMAELAIAGTFSITASGSRDRAAVTPRLALLPGGTIVFNSAYSTLNGDTLDIRGTAANPSLINSSLSYTNDNTRYFSQLNIAFTGDSDAVVKLTRTTIKGDDFQRAIRVKGGFADFLGTVIVDGTHTWLRPETTATTFDVGGTLWITNGASVYVATVSPTFGSLVMASNTTLQIVSGRAVTVTNSFKIAEGATIIFGGASSLKNDYRTGADHSPKGITFISVCGAANAAAVDRTVLFNAVKAGSEQYLYAGAIPRLKLAESVREDGGVDFKLSHEPFVVQTNNCAASKGPYGKGHYEGYLSDGLEISSEYDYVTLKDKAVYFNLATPYEFPGKSWTIIGGPVGFYGGNKMVVEDLRLLDGAWFRQMSKNINAYVEGAATLYGTVNFRVFGSNTFWVPANLSGVGDIIVTLDVDKILYTECTNYRGRLELSGDNSDWTGRAWVGCGRSASAKEGLTNLTLRVTSAASLGGARDAFTFDAVKIADTCTLAITDTATFDAANRGWCLMDGSTVSISSNKTVTVSETVTFGGASKKTGAGALVLGGAAKFYDSASDAATATPNGASFRIAAGALGVTSAEALAGVDLAFAAGTKLLVFPEAEGLTLSSAPTFEGGTLPVELEIEDGYAAGAANILTLPSSVPFDASTLSVAGKKGYRISPVTARTEGDTTTYGVTVSKLGFVILVQ